MSVAAPLKFAQPPFPARLPFGYEKVSNSRLAAIEGAAVATRPSVSSAKAIFLMCFSCLEGLTCVRCGVAYAAARPESGAKKSAEGRDRLHDRRTFDLRKG